MEQMERAGELKRELVEFGHEPRFSRDLNRLIGESLPEGTGGNERLALVVDAFLHDHRFDDGSTVVDRFVAARDDLSDADRELVLSWRDGVQGVFQLTERAGEDGFLARNLIDELSYRIRWAAGAEGVAQLAPGMFMITRVVPVGEDWMLSGAPMAYGADAAEMLLRQATEFAMRNPEAVFRNPDKLERARRLQAEQRDAFIEVFGSDLIVIRGDEVHAKLMEFYRFDFERKGGTVDEWTEPPLPLPPEWTDASSIALIYDLEDGLGFYVDFAVLQAVFAAPRLAVRQQYRDVLTSYLRRPEVSPVPIRRVAGQDTGRADEVFRALLKKPEFSWERDGEALLRKHKPGYFAKPPLPRIMPASDEMSAQMRTAE